MAWFNNNKTPKGETEQSHDTRVEVVVAKEANREMVELAKESNQVLNELLEANHFTIKIFLAMKPGEIKRKRI